MQGNWMHREWHAEASGWAAQLSGSRGRQCLTAVMPISLVRAEAHVSAMEAVSSSQCRMRPASGLFLLSLSSGARPWVPIFCVPAACLQHSIRDAQQQRWLWTA